MAAKDPGKGNKKPSDRRWHSVSIKPTSSACDAAVSGKNRRWLAREAPQLPLPDCSRPDTCRCTYQHHEDRRSGDARRAQERDAFTRPGQVAQERRSRKDRRASRDEQ